MKIEEYQALAMRTSPDGHDRVLNGCLGLIGESGEIVDLVKKWKFQSGDNADLPEDKLIDECGDVLWYCAELCTGRGMDIANIKCRYDHAFIAVMDIITLAVYLSAACHEIYADIKDNCFDDVVHYDIETVMRAVEAILIKFCGSSLEKAMDYNIEKLRKRYPDGFDPERSLNRPE